MSVSSISIGIVAVVLAVIGLDIYLAIDSLTGNTYSEILREWFSRMDWLYYLVGGAIGILLAHWGEKADDIDDGRIPRAYVRVRRNWRKLLILWLVIGATLVVGNLW